MSVRKAVVLLSGGLDSATCLAIAKSEGYQLYAISFQYGQRHRYELDRAESLAKQFAVVSHQIIDINLAQFGGSALTDNHLEVPKSESVEGLVTPFPLLMFPPGTVFLSLALAFAETIASRDLFIGVNSLDYGGYPDCRREYIQAFQVMANLATKIGIEGDTAIRIHTPLIDLTKAEIIQRGNALGVDYGATLSCYDPKPGGVPCEHCDACLLRIKGFEDNGLVDHR